MHEKKFHRLSAREQKVEDQKITHTTWYYDNLSRNYLVFSHIYIYIVFFKFFQDFSLQLKTCSRPLFIELSHYTSFTVAIKEFSLFLLLADLFAIVCYCLQTVPEILQWHLVYVLANINQGYHHSRNHVWGSQEVKILFLNCSYYQILCAEHDVWLRIFPRFSCGGKSSWIFCNLNPAQGKHTYVHKTHIQYKPCWNQAICSDGLL